LNETPKPTYPSREFPQRILEIDPEKSSSSLTKWHLYHDDATLARFSAGRASMKDAGGDWQIVTILGQ